MGFQRKESYSNQESRLWQLFKIAVEEAQPKSILIGKAVKGEK